MTNNYPIMIVEDDHDDCEIIASALKENGVTRELRCFANAVDALHYLRTTTETLFLIISDINMPKMNGLEFRSKLNQDEALRIKSIPFIFLTTSVAEKGVLAAYEMMVQGYFKKPNTFEEMKALLKLTVDYWAKCKHPNAM